MDKPEVIHTLPTKHRLQGRLFTYLGRPNVELIGDLIAGDGKQELHLLETEMDALCSWWLAKRGAPIPVWTEAEIREAILTLSWMKFGWRVKEVQSFIDGVVEQLKKGEA